MTKGQDRRILLSMRGQREAQQFNTLPHVQIAGPAAANREKSLGRAGRGSVVLSCMSA